MPTESDPIYKNVTAADRKKGVLVTGTMAGKSFPSDSDVSESKDWDAYKAEKKLMFTAQRKQYPDFPEWRKKRAAKVGQMKAVSDTTATKAGAVGGSK